MAIAYYQRGCYYIHEKKFVVCSYSMTFNSIAFISNIETLLLYILYNTFMASRGCSTILLVVIHLLYLNEAHFV